jgi:carbonic anhydrase/acetyltransferase-like protein (isoleucine patch superfamily)
MKIPPRSLVMGAPATIKRTLSEKESADLQSIAARYVNYQEDYRTHVQRIA